jgi:hypothetical protein
MKIIATVRENQLRERRNRPGGYAGAFEGDKWISK